jgi:hypothetical protein
MKTCPNCRAVYGDDYAGSCTDCGRGLGGVAANGDSGLEFRLRSQLGQATRENAQEMRMKRGDYSGVPIPPGLMDVARSFVVVDHEKLAQLERDNAA